MSFLGSDYTSSAQNNFFNPEPKGVDASKWSKYPAIQEVDMSNNDVVNVANLTAININATQKSVINLNVSNDATIGNQLSVNGLIVANETNTIGDATIGNDLDVSNDATIGNNLTISNSLDVAEDIFCERIHVPRTAGGEGLGYFGSGIVLGTSSVSNGVISSASGMISYFSGDSGTLRFGKNSFRAGATIEWDGSGADAGENGRLILRSTGGTIIHDLNPTSASFDTNVGIGTTTPSEKLEVNGNVLIDDAQFEITSSTTSAVLVCKNQAINSNNEGLFYGDTGLSKQVPFTQLSPPLTFSTNTDFVTGVISLNKRFDFNGTASNLTIKLPAFRNAEDDPRVQHHFVLRGTTTGSNLILQMTNVGSGADITLGNMFYINNKITSTKTFGASPSTIALGTDTFYQVNCYSTGSDNGEWIVEIS